MQQGRSVQDTLSLTMSALWLIPVLILMLCGIISLCSWCMEAVGNLSEASSSTASASQEQTAEPTDEKIALPALKSTSTETPSESDQGKVASATTVIGKIIEERVNLRSTPSTTADIIGKAKQNDRVTLTGQSADGKWYRAKAKDTSTCWIFSETLEITEGDPTVLPVIAVNP